MFGFVFFVISGLLLTVPNGFKGIFELVLDLERTPEIFARIPQTFLFDPWLHVPSVLVVPISFVLLLFTARPLQVLRLESVEFGHEGTVLIEDPKFSESMLVRPFAQTAVHIELEGIDVIVPLDPLDVTGYVDAHPLVLVLSLIEDPEDGLEAAIENAWMNVELEELIADAFVHLDLTEGLPTALASPKVLDVAEAGA